MRQPWKNAGAGLLVGGVMLLLVAVSVTGRIQPWGAAAGAVSLAAAVGCFAHAKGRSPALLLLGMLGLLIVPFLRDDFPETKPSFRKKERLRK